jgi:hypothetical protein
MKRLIGLCALVSLSIPVSGEAVSKVGTTAATFLEIGIGPRAIGMGGAFVAVADDATASYWNPAGISRLPKNEVSLVHAEWLADTNSDFAAIVLPLGQFGTIGANITSLTMADMEVTTIEDQDGTGEMFGAADLALGVSYARDLTDRFSIGFNGKYIRQRIWHSTASSIALDVGTLYTTQFNDMRIGMSISNFGNKMRLEGKDTLVRHDNVNAHLDTGRWSLPLIFRVGVAMDVVGVGDSRLTVAADALHPNDNTECVNFGAEYGFAEMFFLRVGYKSLFTQDSEQGLTAGAGVRWGVGGTVSLKVDYAFADFGWIQDAHRFSLGAEF